MNRTAFLFESMFDHVYKAFLPQIRMLLAVLEILDTFRSCFS